MYSIGPGGNWLVRNGVVSLTMVDNNGDLEFVLSF